MARAFNGTNQNINYGSDASIDAFTTKTISMWINRSAAASAAVLVKDRLNTGWVFRIRSATDVLSYFDDFSTTDANWETNAAVGTGMLHIGMTYDNSSVSNNVVFYINGVVAPSANTIAPVGTVVSDAAQSMISGETGAGTLDYNGDMGWIIYHDTIWTAAQINMARWWGTPFQGVKVYHPLVTTSLINKGTATANGTATGATMSNIPRVERNWGMLMGCGR